MFLINIHAILCALRDPTRWVILGENGVKTLLKCLGKRLYAF